MTPSEINHSSALSTRSVAYFFVIMFGDRTSDRPIVHRGSGTGQLKAQEAYAEWDWLDWTIRTKDLVIWKNLTAS